MKNNNSSEDSFIGLFEGLDNNEIKYDMAKWLQDKIEYEAMLHRVFGSSDLNNKGNKTSLAK